MKRSKRILAVIVVTALVLCSGASALGAETGYTVDAAGLTLTLPENTYVFTPDTPDDDPSWKAAGLTESVKYKTEYSSLGTLAHFSTDGGKTNVYLGKKESDTTKGYFNLADLTDAERESFRGMFNSKEEDEDIMESVAEYYEHPQVPFLSIRIHSKMPQAEEEGVAYEALYSTVVNGYSVSFSQHGPAAFTEADTAFMQQLVDSVRFADLQHKPKADPESVRQAFLILGVAVVFIGAIVLALVISKVNARRRKERIRRLAERLSQYRKDKADKDASGRTPLFENITDHTDAAVRVFSRYYTYVKKPLGPIISIAVSILGLAISIWLSGEWWMSLLMIVAFVFCSFKFITAGKTMEKAQKRVYAKLKSRKAKYVFYEDEFTISGTQSAGSYPYFQITAVDDWKDYFYLYFGEGNAHYVEKNSFSLGEAASFKKFILQKTKE